MANRRAASVIGSFSLAESTAALGCGRFRRCDLSEIGWLLPLCSMQTRRLFALRLCALHILAMKKP